MFLLFSKQNKSRYQLLGIICRVSIYSQRYDRQIRTAAAFFRRDQNRVGNSGWILVRYLTPKAYNITANGRPSLRAPTSQ